MKKFLLIVEGISIGIFIFLPLAILYLISGTVYYFTDKWTSKLINSRKRRWASILKSECDKMSIGEKK